MVALASDNQRRIFLLGALTEGVATVEQHDFLKSIGYKAFQGDLLSRPVPAANLSRFVCSIRSGDDLPGIFHTQTASNAS